MSAKIKRVLRYLDLLLHQKSKLMQNETIINNFNYYDFCILRLCSECRQDYHA